MSTWRRKAIECLPELRKEFEQTETSIYVVFSEMLTALVDAHKQTNIARLKQIYDFAEWCLSQKEKDLWNAAGVAFYEHLGDYEETMKEFPKWIKSEIYSQIRGLLELRIQESELKKLDKLYGYHELT